MTGTKGGFRKMKAGSSLLSAAAAAKSHSPTLCDPIDSSPPGLPIPGVLQARTLEWVAVSSSNAWNRKVKVKSLSRVWLFATPRTAAYQAPPSTGFSRQEYWSGVPLPSPFSCLLLAKWTIVLHPRNNEVTQLSSVEAQPGTQRWNPGKYKDCASAWCAFSACILWEPKEPINS